MIIGTLIYLLLAAAAAGVLTTVWVFTRPMRTRDDVRSGRVILFTMLLTTFGPFAYVEVMTRQYGPQVQGAIKDAYRASPIDGPMQYFRVLSLTGAKAKAIIVGLEDQSWGGTDRPLLTVELKKKGQDWEVESYKVVSSDRLNKDGFLLPPYR